LAFFTNCFGVSIPNSEIIPDKFLFFVLSKAGFITSIFSLFVPQTSRDDLFSIFTLFVNFSATPQEYLGTLWSFARFTNVLVPILFATVDFVKASAPKRNRSHFFSDCSAARSGETTTLIFAFAKSLAVVLPCKSGSTSDV